MMSIGRLCEWAQVSRSGFYKYLNRIKLPTNKELSDREDFEYILEAYNYRGYKKGSRSIFMRLMRNGHPMSRNKIRRIMNKYKLFCPIRKINPYKQMAKALDESTVAPNVLKRHFKDMGPRYVILTDITYLFYGNCQKCYVSVMKDAYTNEILGYAVSSSMEEDFVLDTVKMCMSNHKHEIPQNALIHSDQGFHYKAYSFKQLLHDNELRQSMSRKANCWDNAPQESFFGHMKDEIDISGCNIFDEVENVIDDYIEYYNNDRPQWDLAYLTPSEYYKYSITGQYPINLKKLPSKKKNI